ncbi:glycoside hydrolase [Amanita rubescens]|nr:glycoside hydrolase [Amanita rubescens]
MSPPPHFVVYHDQNDPSSLLPPDVSRIKGFNVYNLSFLLSSGATDRVAAWADLSPSARAEARHKYHSAGVKLFVSAFGYTDKPTARDPAQVAEFIAGWAKEYHVDGVDVNFEDEDAFKKGVAEDWLIAFTIELRARLPREFLISHAHIRQLILSNSRFGSKAYPGGGYIRINKEIGHEINWYNVQYGHHYNTPEAILRESGAEYPGTSVFQIHAHGVPLSKILIGKSADPRDTPPSVLAVVLEQGKKEGWNGGVAAWQYPSTDTKWITEVRSKSWPV